MNRNISSIVEEYIKNRKNWNKWRKIFSVMACLVVFCTTYALILPAITMENKAYCGREEHLEHSIEAGCYEVTQELICEDSLKEEHEHTDSCYKTSKELTCDREESEGHKHDDSCYNEEGELICDKNESEGHKHDDSCYKENKELVCGKEEFKAHEHTEECYRETRELTCDKEIHTHELICFSDKNADLETAKDWEKKISKVELTGKWEDDLVAIADTQIDYKESTKNYIVDEEGNAKGYTRYGAWAKDEYADWDGMFVAFCLHYAKVDSKLLPVETDLVKWVKELSKEKIDLYRDLTKADVDYTPKAGDLIFFDAEYEKEVKDGINPEVKHIGIVSEIIKDANDNITKMKVIEGDVEDAVEENEYQLKNKMIIGYAEMPANPDYKEELPEELATTEEIAPEVATTEEIAPEVATTEEIAPEVATTEEAAPEVATTEEAAPEVATTEEKAPEVATTEEKVPEVATTEEKAPEVATTEEKVPEEATTEEKAPEVATTEEAAPEVATTEEVAPEEETTEEVVEEEIPEEDIIERHFKGHDYSVTATYTLAAGIPAEAEFHAEEIKPGTSEYDIYYQKAAEALKIDLSEEEEEEANLIEAKEGITFARFFDISFMIGDVEYEPIAPVNVSIQYDEPMDIEEANQVAAVHFANQGTEVLEVETSLNVTEDKADTSSEEENAVDTFAFTQDSFSITGTVVTGNTMPTGNVVIFMKEGNNYYAIDKDKKAVKVEYSDGTIYCDSDSNDLIWNISPSDTDNNYYIKNIANSKYLTISTSAVNIRTSQEATRATYNDGWRVLKRTGTFLNRSYYYMNLNSSHNFVVSQTAQTVYFATNIVSNTPVTPVTPDEQNNIEAIYDHNKTIDYLGDGGTNHLTALSGEDLYRLSLDITGIRKPVDMLLVVDASGSMQGCNSGEGITNGMPEVIKFLNGTGSGTYGYNENVSTFNDESCDGFIKEFFEINKENRLAIAAFGGYDPCIAKTNVGYTDLSSNTDYDYKVDGWEVKGWNDIGEPYNSVPVAKGYYPDHNSSNKPSRSNTRKGPGLFIEDKKEYKQNRWNGWIQGTNYCAGFMVAEDMFKKLGNGGTERIRIMVFLSDGMPTYSIVETNNTTYKKYGDMYYMRRGQGQKRYYKDNDESTSDGTPGINDTYYDSEQAFERYHQKFPEVVNYSIAFKVKEADEDVLKYIGSTDKNRSNEENFKRASKYTDITEMILGVFRPLDVSIIDKLTNYVEFYTPEPDVKVTQTPKDGGDPIVLWEGSNPGTGTSKNTYDYVCYDTSNTLTHTTKPIVESVSFQDGQITAKFDEHFTLDQSYTYALSFNVRSTDQAYDTYALSGYNSRGDEGTDYTNNSTSSNSLGLKSNASASVQYKNSTHQTGYSTATYKDPVIQVDKSKLVLTKVDQYNQPLSGASFGLKKDGQSIDIYDVSEAGTVTIPCEDLISGNYTLEEIEAPVGAIKSNEVIDFTVERGRISYLPTADGSDWTWGRAPDKVTGTVNNKTTYPKNREYQYNLTIRNTVPPETQDILLQKVDAFGSPLNGASFTLYQDVTDAEAKPTETVNKTFTIEQKEVNKDVLIIGGSLQSSKQEVTIGDQEKEIDALIYSGSLEIGTYYLVEDTAPDGYNKLTEPVVIIVGTENVVYKYQGTQLVNPVMDGEENITNSVRITNTNGYELPETGGMGTDKFTIGGMALIFASLYFGITSRRKQERRNE